MKKACSTSIPHNQLNRSLQSLTTTSWRNRLNRAIEYLPQARGYFTYTHRLVFSPTPGCFTYTHDNNSPTGSEVTYE